MPILYPDILSITSDPQSFAWDERETMLYALSIGMGADPMNSAELPFVYEHDLRAVPTMATTVAWGAGPSIGKMGINYLFVVHGEQKVEFHKPFPARAQINAKGRVVGAYDKGDKGAVIYTETLLRETETGAPLATLTSSTFARGDGGFGGPTDGAPEPHRVPDRAPDLSLEFATRPDQALLYRLCGDRNPLHADPAIAAAAGFPRPILHGLCTYGLTCRAVMQAFTDFDPTAIKSHQVRFSAPVFPGETLIVDLWRDGVIVAFEARVKERGSTVIRHGKSVLG